MNNVLFIELVVDRLIEITFPRNISNENHAEDEQEETDLSANKSYPPHQYVTENLETQEDEIYTSPSSQNSQQLMGKIPIAYRKIPNSYWEKSGDKYRDYYKEYY
jgi:hypothetical protein